MPTRISTDIFVELDDCRVITIENESSPLVLKLGKRTNIFLSFSQALALAHLLRVAAGAEEPRTSEASDASA